MAITTPANASNQYKSEISAITGVYSVTDTSLADHANASAPGTIAEALSLAGAAGGGRVVVGPGTYNISTGPLVLQQNVTLSGSGRLATIINQTVTNTDVIVIDSGTDYLNSYATVEHLDVQFPAGGTSGNAFSTATKRGNYARFIDLRANGGESLNWGLNIDGSNGCTTTDFRSENGCSGILVDNTSSDNINYGDSVFIGCHITLTKNNGTGIRLICPAAGIINNNSFFGNSLNTTGNPTGCTGIEFDASSGAGINRNFFTGTDIENMAIGVDLIGTAINFNTHIHTLILNCVIEFQDASNSDTNSILSGQGGLKDEESYKRYRQPILYPASGTTNLTFKDALSIIDNLNNAPMTYELPELNGTFGSVEFVFTSTKRQPITINAFSGDFIFTEDGIYITRTSSSKYGDCVTLKGVSGNAWVITSERGVWTGA